MDVPLVPEAVFRSLSDAWTRAGEPPLGWLAPRVLNGNLAQFGHPVVIGPALLEKLSDFADDTPLSHLRTQAEPLFYEDTTSLEVLFDLDTPEDLERLLRESRH